MMNRRKPTELERIAVAHLIGARRARATWFKQVTLYATRAMPSVSTRIFDLEQADHESAAAWLERELHRPASSLNHRTARIAGKPYHWRQDYTGQLKLAAGESPWCGDLGVH